MQTNKIYCIFTAFILTTLVCGCNQVRTAKDSRPIDDPRILEANKLRYGSEDMSQVSREDLVAAKRLLNEVAQQYPGNVLITFDLCQYDVIVNTSRAVQYCSNALNLIAQNTDRSLFEYEKLTLSLDINKKLCELHLIRSEFSDATNSCREAELAIENIKARRNILPDDIRVGLESPDFKISQEVYVQGLLDQAQKRHSDFVLRSKPICDENPSDTLCTS